MLKIADMYQFYSFIPSLKIVTSQPQTTMAAIRIKIILSAFYEFDPELWWHSPDNENPSLKLSTVPCYPKDHDLQISLPILFFAHKSIFTP